ncbi:hypothetical protein F5X96DRAFT_582473 [Biscogniauxia mediterranea]|nr:hypothetical protein F5X96DRAFT_582473 [Biscogniauxia mediterranea]
MQGDIFQMEQLLGSQVQVQLPPPSAAPKLRSKLYTSVEPQAAIYNEDDLSHLLYVDEARHPRHHHQHRHHHHEQHHFHNNDKILINDVSQHHDEEDDAELTPPEFLSPLTGGTGTHTPFSTGSETPVLSYCGDDSEADADNEAASSSSPPAACLLSQRLHQHHAALAREDGFEFPVFLGRQDDSDDSDDSNNYAADDEGRHAWLPATATKKTAGPLQIDTLVDAAPVAVHDEEHVSAIDGPLMSWWPAPAEGQEHEWVTADEDKSKPRNLQEQEQKQKKIVVLPTRDERHSQVVSDISGPLMTWWPAPQHLLEHEWIEAFYE